MDRRVIELDIEEQIRINEELKASGVRMIDPAAAYIAPTVKVEPGAVIYPNVILEGETTIAADAIIYQGCRIVDSQIGRGTTVQSSVIYDSQIGCDTEIGPCAYIRPNSKIGDACRVGDFVEVKNSTVGDGAKISHLTYIGDGDVGQKTNIGCGTVFVNYDGKNKHRTVVGAGCFIGCNANLVAPVTVGDGAFIAAGSTITEDVPAGTLAVARGRQVVKEGWVSPKDR